MKLVLATTLVALCALTAACSSAEDTLVGEWQANAPEPIHLSIAKRNAPRGPAGEGGGYYDGFSITQGGRTYTVFWMLDTDSGKTVLKLSTGGMVPGQYALTALRLPVAALGSDTFSVTWGQGNYYTPPQNVVEFHRVK